MGFRLKKKQTKEALPEPPNSQQLASMSADDLYLFLETLLMESQYRLTQYRSAGKEDRLAHLEWLRSAILSASIGARALESKTLAS